MKRVIGVLILIAGFLLLAWASADTFVIPASVTEIEKEAFYGDASIDEVVLPEGIKKIGARAFAESGLKKINLPDSLEEIANDAFDVNVNIIVKEGSKAYNWAVSQGRIDGWFSSPIEDFQFNVLSETTCEMIRYSGNETSVIIPMYDGDGRVVTTIGSGAFRGQKDITEIVMPATIVEIKDLSFALCSALSAINLSNNTIRIGDSAFLACENLNAICLPKSLKEIGYDAFRRCSSLHEIVIPFTVEMIAENAFEYCLALESIIVEKDNLMYTSDCGVLFNKNKNALIKYPNGKKELVYYVPQSVTKINNYAFSGNIYLEEAVLPEGLYEVCSYAFQNCKSLTSISIPKTVEFIGSTAFYGCNKYLKIDTVPDSYAHRWAIDMEYIPNLDDYEIENGKIIKYLGSGRNIRIPTMDNDGTPITIIGEFAFDKCNSIQTVDIPEGITTIEQGAFEWCHYLLEVRIADSVTSIGDHCFNYCPRLTSINIPSQLEELKGGVFRDCTGLRSIVFPSKLKRISGFLHCTNLDNILIPHTIEEIGNFAFNECYNLKNLTIEYGLTWISHYSFCWCKNLEYVYIPESVTRIGAEAFKGCESLKAVYIPSSVTYMYEDVFLYDSLVTIYGVAGSYAESYAKRYNLPFSSTVCSVSISEFESSTVFNIFFDAFEGNREYSLLASSSLNGEFMPVTASQSELFGKKVFTTSIMNGQTIYYKIKGNKITTCALDPYSIGRKFRYEIVTGSTIRILGIYSSVDLTEVIIPDEIDGYKVVDIASNAFKIFYNLERIILPESLASYKDKLELPSSNPVVIVSGELEKIKNSIAIEAVIVGENYICVDFRNIGFDNNNNCTYSLWKCDQPDGTYELVSDSPEACDTFEPATVDALLLRSLIDDSNTKRYYKIKKSVMMSNGRSIEVLSDPLDTRFTYTARIPCVDVEGIGANGLRFSIHDSTETWYSLVGGKEEKTIMRIMLFGEEAVTTFDVFGNTAFDYRYAMPNEMNKLFIHQSRRDDNNVLYIGKRLYETSVYPLATPQAFTSKNTSSVGMYWESVQNAQSYEIYTSSNGIDYELFENTVDTVITIPFDSTTEKIYIRIRAKRTDEGINSFSSFFEIIEPISNSDGVIRILSLYEANYDNMADMNTFDSEYYLRKAFQQGTPHGLPVISQNYFIDLTRGRIIEKIADCIANKAQDTDVSVLFFSCHGNEWFTVGDNAGYLMLTNGDKITFTELADWLEGIPGEVILIFGSCGSGSSIGETYYDSPIDYIFGQLQSLYAPLRKEKFKVICGAKGGNAGQYDHYEENDQLIFGFNEIVQFIYDGSVHGDYNQDGTITLGELASYIQSKAYYSTGSGTAGKYTAVWPEDSDYPFFVK